MPQPQLLARPTRDHTVVGMQRIRPGLREHPRGWPSPPASLSVRAPRRGLTIVEMVATIAVLALVTAISAYVASVVAYDSTQSRVSTNMTTLAERVHELNLSQAVAGVQPYSAAVFASSALTREIPALALRGYVSRSQTAADGSAVQVLDKADPVVPGAPLIGGVGSRDLVVFVDITLGQDRLCWRPPAGGEGNFVAPSEDQDLLSPNSYRRSACP